MLAAHRASGDGEKTAGKNFSGMRDKDETLAVIDGQQSGNGALQSVHRPRGNAIFSGAAFLLKHKAAIMLGLSGLDLEGHLSGKAVELTEGCLKFSAGKQIIHLAASCGNQKERAPQNQPKILQQVG